MRHKKETACTKCSNQKLSISKHTSGDVAIPRSTIINQNFSVMTKKEARKKTRELIRRSADRMRKNVERVFLSGAVNLTSYEDNYVLPNAIMLALLKEEMKEFQPPQFSKYKKQVEKDAKNIYACI